MADLEMEAEGRKPWARTAFLESLQLPLRYELEHKRVWGKVKWRQLPRDIFQAAKAVIYLRIAAFLESRQPIPVWLGF